MNRASGNPRLVVGLLPVAKNSDLFFRMTILEKPRRRSLQVSVVSSAAKELPSISFLTLSISTMGGLLRRLEVICFEARHSYDSLGSTCCNLPVQ